jgi:hypothetical protein
MPRMPHSRTWQKTLSGLVDHPKALALVSSSQARYDGLWVMVSAEEDRANRVTLKNRILPGLAIYQALLDENSDRQKTLADVDILFRAAFFSRRMQRIRVLNYFPDPFPIVKPVLKIMTKDEYMPSSQEIVEDSADCYAVNIYRCFILDMLSKHDARELTACFCNTDDWLAEVLPKIRWERTQTLGHGGDRCDFRWRRIK